MDDLILQLKAHALPATTTARIKLWICEGALHSAQERSFAENFSKKIYDAGYTSCHVFGYPASVFAEYQSGSDNTMRKRVVKPEAVKVREGLDKFKAAVREKDQFVDLIDHRKVFALFPDRDLARIAQAWSVALWQAKGSEDGAIEAILRNGVLKNQLIPGASVGGRAKDVRIEFFNGALVG